jgi:hypothetical protein
MTKPKLPHSSPFEKRTLLFNCRVLGKEQLPIEFTPALLFLILEASIRKVQTKKASIPMEEIDLRAELNFALQNRTQFPLFKPAALFCRVFLEILSYG